MNYLKWILIGAFAILLGYIVVRKQMREDAINDTKKKLKDA